jgi:hypothetical protein
MGGIDQCEVVERSRMKKGGAPFASIDRRAAVQRMGSEHTATSAR